MNALEAYRKALRELSERHAAELPRKLAEIEEAWARASASGGERDLLAGLRRTAHGFDVACSLLGLPALSAPARRLAAALASMLGSGAALGPAESRRIEGLLADLRAAARALPSPEAREPAAGYEAPPADPPPVTAPERPAPQPRPGAPVARPIRPTTGAARLVYLLERDADLAAGLATQLAPFGYDTRLLPKADTLADAITREQPYAVLLDPDLPGDGAAVTRALASLDQARIPRIPLVFLSSRNDIHARLESVRAGAVAYFPKPVRITDLVDKLDALATRDVPEPYRVMIVDADDARADLCRALLHEVGMEVCLVHDPADIVTLLGDFNPELLLIALVLPQCGGDELAQVVHQIPSYVSLPVVFLSEQWNLDRQIGLMNFGGDALLPLPLQGSQLVSTVIARVERYRTLSSLMQNDSLTGLLNHSRLHQYVEIEALRALRQSHPLSFAMIDIDHFKSINDQFGHPVGDRILKNLARFLRQNLRKSDIVGRYGGEEFAVLLTDTDAPAALAVIEKLCTDFARVEHDADGVALSVTFSAGVASMGSLPSARELVLAADRALYEAKRQGRNRVVLAGASPPAQPAPPVAAGV